MTPAPTTPGPMIFRVCRTAGVSRGRRNRSATPALAQDSRSQRNCATPAADKAQANTCPSCQWKCAINSKPAIRKRFNRIGVAAGAAKRSTVLRSPPCSAVSEMNKRYGKVMRVKVTTRSNLPGSASKPGAMSVISQGMNISPSSTNRNSAANRTENASSAKARSAGFPPSASAPEASGTKAALNAPSANRLRNKFGKRWATKNASATGPAPRIAAVRMSRMKPKTRLTSV